MEALRSHLTTGEQSGGQERCQPESPQRGPQPKSPSQPSHPQRTHGTPQQPRRRQNPERKRHRHQPQSIEAPLEPKHEATAATKATAVSSLSPGVLTSSAGTPTQSKPETQEGTPKQKRERKPQRPGKYVCTYCGRACAKPSVLQKHIRSHTGERPYPCAPCGFSFKTKSNLYKHRKSHTHRVKAGLALGEPKSVEDQVTESEDETKPLSSASSLTERQGSVTENKSHETDRAKDCTGGNTDSYAVKKRLALRLSRGKHAPQDSSDEKTSSLTLGSRGSTESGYFSRSESTEQSQDSPPNTSAKSYAEIILGKYGRLGHLQRMSRHHNQHPSGQEDKNLSFTVPKKQVIDHITKLITINEAVVDTSKIDSVKPRRFSLSRKNSSESQKSSSAKESLIHSPKAGDLGYKSSGSITMGVPCEKFHHQSQNVEQPAGQTSTAPLVRSHSMPSAASSFDASSGGRGKFRLSQSFDERQASETQATRRYGMLRRQPAIEIPLCAELTKEEHEGSRSFYPDGVTAVPDHQQSQPQPYECEACGVGCKDWEGYKKHKQSLCPSHHPRNEAVISQMERSQLMNHAVRAGASTLRKRRKEESFEFDDPSSPSPPSPALLSGQCKDESGAAYEGPRRPALQTCSVIQHTSSFEKQESLCNENQGVEATKSSPPEEEYQLVPQTQPQQQTAKLTARKLVRQHNVQVPEILVTEDSNVRTDTSTETNSTAKHSEKPDEFQWPQRSPSLAQLPIEKLPPKKKRLRLAEVAQSSGESSFDSISLPRSPSQDSSTSYASSRSTSFEEPNRPDMEMATSTPLRKSRAPHMLTVPGVHQHREMRRSASEQAPHDSQPSVLMAETRSKSFDYSCLSPERSAVGWRERRKCLLMRHTAIRDPDEEEEEQCTVPSRSPERVSPSRSSQASPTSVYCTRSSSSPLSGDTVLRNPVGSQCKELFSQWKLSQNIQLMGSKEVSHDQPLAAKQEALHIHTELPPPQAPQPYPTHGPSGAARAHYLPMSTGLKLEIPLRHDDYSDVRVGHSHIQHSAPHITSSLETLRPVTSPDVAVRLQTATLTPACAIYTMLSQSTSPTPLEAVDAVTHNVGISAAEYRNHRNMSPDLQLWSDDGLRLSGSGGNKRMLSPSNSIELPPESQQQQKRVKEEEEREAGCSDKATEDARSQELRRETCRPGVCSPVSHVGPSFPSLLSSTCNSWCYLNYIKPNPSALDEQRPSVYSSWSTSGYDPNPPGLSSKTALSLLHCKQRLSPSIYTVSAMSVRTAESMEQEDNKRPCSTEVYNSPPYCRDLEGTGTGPPSAEDNRSHRKEEEEKKKQQEEDEEEVPMCSRDKQSPAVWITERGSNKKYGFIRGGGGGGGGGGGEVQSEDSAFHCRNTSVLSTESTPCSCSHCNSTFPAKVSPTERLTSKTPGKNTCCYPEDAHEGVCEDQPVHPDPRKDPERSDLGTGGDHEEDVVKDKSVRYDEGDGARPGGQLVKPECSSSLPLPPKDSTQSSSASTRRALFARRRLDASASGSSRGSRSPSTQSSTPPREPSPPRSPSLRPRRSPTPPSPLSPPSCHVSTTPQRQISPVRGLSPRTAQSQGSDPAGPPGALADATAQCQTCLHPRDQLSAARLSVDEVGLTHNTVHPARPRGAHNLLSHLPLHSQQPGRSQSLLISIGGMHMIQPRSLIPLYSLVSSATANTATPGAPRRPSDAPKGRLALPLHWDALKETSPRSRASPPHAEESGPTHGKSPGCFGIQRPPSPGTETRHPEVSTDAPVTERRVHPENTAGQKKAPPSHTQL
ncbi:transcription factor HIVEP3 [Brachyistius frenatus]|uniref:transcription factor HIVEP3 n=1 Tax=Brachyistius frenatus TaxID=100188 RepID=UPI0037E7457C